MKYEFAKIILILCICTNAISITCMFMLILLHTCQYMRTRHSKLAIYFLLYELEEKNQCTQIVYVIN